MKIATYNIQNLFHRDKSLFEKPYGQCMANWGQELNVLIRESPTTGNRIDRIQELAFLLGFDKTFHLPYAVMRKRAGFLFLKGTNYSKEMKAGELTDWNGWVSVQTMPLDPSAIENKAKVIAEINPDILLTQEVEDRASLEEFNANFLPQFDCQAYRETAVLQGSNYRGLEMGMLLKNGHQINFIKSHRFEQAENNLSNNEFFQYEIKLHSNQRVWVLAAQLQEKGKDKEVSDGQRQQQAQQVAEVYRQLRAEGKENIIVAGTLNAVSYCDSLSPLLRDTDLTDVTKHPSFHVDVDKGRDASYFRMGAYRMGVNIKQKDYLLLSPKLFSRVKDSGLNRKAVWPGKKPKWPVYPSVQNKKQAASAHPAIWAAIKV